jgi:hypothetical protein
MSLLLLSMVVVWRLFHGPGVPSFALRAGELAEG